MTGNGLGLASAATEVEALVSDLLDGKINTKDSAANGHAQAERADRRAQTRKSTATKRRFERAQLVLSAMRAGAALHLAFEQGRPCWSLSTGQTITPDIADLVTASASVIGIEDALFENEPGQTWRWWHP